MNRPAPLTLGGRQTLVYLVFAGCGPSLTAIVVWAMVTVRDFAGATALDRLDKFATLAILIAAALMVIVVALACFVSIRAIKLGKSGLEAESNGGGDAVTTTVTSTATGTAPAGSTVDAGSGGG